MKNRYDGIKSYVSWSLNKSNLKNSSSGGIFFEVAKKIIEEGGYVSGCVMINNKPYHIITNNLKKLKEMRGSKYVQSNMDLFYKELINIDYSKQLLFVGTPCQTIIVKRVYKKLKGNTKNLFIITLFCHGVPSYKLLEEYLKTFKRKVKNINFRDKTKSWKKFGVRIIFDDDSQLFQVYKKNKYMQTYLSNIALNENCYNCSFIKLPTNGDLMLGDFWGIPDSKMNIFGTSAILTNTPKGDKLIKELHKKHLIHLKDIDINLILKGNPKLIDGIIERPLGREKFILELEKYSFNRAYYKILIPYLFKRKIMLWFLRIGRLLWLKK
ncbi:MAG: Coenzyme F420 hydrogenase/dehydrogenase, beta subunit C-terminal domain [archaeon]